jgi:hypothetical protein
MSLEAVYEAIRWLEVPWFIPIRINKYAVLSYSAYNNEKIGAARLWWKHAPEIDNACDRKTLESRLLNCGRASIIAATFWHLQNPCPR